MSRSTGRPARGSPPATGDNGTRTPAWRSGSRGQRRAAARLELLVGAAPGGIEAPGQDIGLDLPVPLIRQELLEPLREAIELLGRELGDGGLEFFDAHDLQPNVPSPSPARAHLAGDSSSGPDVGSRATRWTSKRLITIP